MKNKNISIYHYTKVDTLLNFILPKMRLRMNALANTNDPSEGFWQVLDEWFNPDALQYERLTEVKNLSFCKDNKTKIPENNKYGFAVHPMWAHYAENWSGVCLEIDLNTFIKNNKQLIEKYKIVYDSIKYTNSRKRKEIHKREYDRFMIGYQPTDIKSYVAKQLDDKDFIEERFFKKDITWSYEQEFRFVALQDFEKDIYLKLDESIKRIILGPKFNISLYPSIRDMVSNNDLDTNIIRHLEIDEKGSIQPPFLTYDSYYNVIINRKMEFKERVKRISKIMSKTKKLDLI